MRALLLLAPAFLSAQTGTLDQIRQRDRLIIGNKQVFPVFNSKDAATGRNEGFFADVARRATPDVVLTHRLEDRHQDHRTVAELTWQAWRDHLVLEYEIPKYEGDLGQPNVYVPLPAEIARRKVRHLMKHVGTQRSKGWFTEATFQGLMALRGIECRAPSGQAEALHARKVVL